jgi:hypothetical protein
MSARPDFDDVAAAWQAYQAAAQRLDAVRRGAADEANRQAQAGQAARQELTRLRARLAPQHARLRELGVPAESLLPAGEQVAAVAGQLAGGPATVLTAVQAAGVTVDRADALVVGAAGPGTRTAPVWLRNLLVYGPFALVVLAVQLALLLAGGGAVALAWGLLMPVVSFGLGWLVVGLAFPAGPTGRVDRTPRLGGVVCAAPTLVTCLGAVAMRLFG